MAVANNQYINFDLLRYQNEVLDITNKFKGRVGDTQDYIKLFVTSNSYPVDLRGMKLLFGGVDPKQVAHRHYLDFRADQKTDNLEQGRCTVYFDENTFNYEGEWTQAYFKFIDENGNTVSTVNMKLVAMGDQVYAAVGQVANITIDEFDKEYEKVREAGKKTEALFNSLSTDAKAKYQATYDEYKQAIQEAYDAIFNAQTGLKVNYDRLQEMAQHIQETLRQAQFHDRPFQFDTVAIMKSHLELQDGDLVITSGWDSRNDGHGNVWQVRAKKRDETPDEINVIALQSGYVAERNLSMISADSLEDIMYGYSIKIVHNQKDYPKPTVFYYENALGTEVGGLGAGSFGETLTKLVPCEAEYTDNNSIVVRIPRNFYMDAKPYYKYGDWYLGSGNKTIKISLGNVDDSAAKAGDGKGSSHL
ncbi:BppU family phage baseplate upper protein [Ligilactobacillus salivarius]|uniref:BppU family phage baseplate upper protein n=1 Tax=Ligilactobacillus salivarius TaxID=1624 RepID=UPI0013722417|nr:BppU family phage baseplate upper protein [Ligilactobacillus salivarius]